MMALPSGAVRFLFTDIEGSTSLWEAHTREQPVLQRSPVSLRTRV